MRKKPGFTGGISPMNTLTGSRETQHRRIAPIVSSPSRPPSISNTAKHLAGESHAEHTTAQFAPLLPRNDGPVRTPHRGRKRSLDSITLISDGSQSHATARSTIRNSTHSNVDELRGVPGYQKTPRARKRYRKSNEGGVLDLDPIASQSPAEEDVLMIDSQEAEESNPIRLDDLRGRFEQRTSPRQKRVSSTGPARDSSHPKRGRMGCSPDHLAPTVEEMSKKRAHATNPSVSTRGDIARSTFVSKTEKRSKGSNKAAQVSPIGAAKEVIKGGLRVRRAVSGANRYDETTFEESVMLTLVVREISHILHPEFSNVDTPTSLQWCTINLAKAIRVEIPEEEETDSTLVFIQRSTDIHSFAAAFIMLDFESTRDLQAFQDWIEIYTVHLAQPFLISRSFKLKEKFTNQWNKAAQSAGTKAKMNSSDNSRNVLAESQDLMERRRKAQPNEISPIAKGVATRAIDLVGGGNMRARKLKDAMSTAAPSIPTKSDAYAVPPESLPLHGRPTRTTRTTVALRETSPPVEFPRWTKEHADWAKDWAKSVVYPPTGKNRAVVDAEDIERLDEGEFLNDNLIIFYLRYLQNKLEIERKDLADRIYFHNTFFYERLKPAKSGAGINYDNVKGWTNKVDLFSKDFIIVPINEFAHWYVAIICNAPKLIERGEDTNVDCMEPKNDNDHLEMTQDVDETKNKQINLDDVVSSDVIMDDSTALAAELSRAKLKSPPAIADGTNSQTSGLGFGAAPKRKKSAKRQSTGPRQHDPNSPRIITLDSLATPHSPVCGNLRNYLIAEANDKKGIDISDTGKLGMTARDLPLQMNHCDCGLYLLGYIQQFLKNPDQFVGSLMLHQEIEWNLDSSALRNGIRSLLFDLQEEQKQRDQAEAIERKNRKREAHKARQQQVDEEKTTAASDVLTPDAPISSASSPQVNASPERAERVEKPPVSASNTSRLLHSTRGAFQISEDPGSLATDAQPEVVDLHHSIEQSSGRAMKQEDQSLPAREVEEESHQPHYIPTLPDSTSEVSQLESKGFVDATDDDDHEQAELVYKPEKSTSISRFEIRPPQLKKDSPKSSPELHCAEQPAKQTGKISTYFAGRRPGDSRGKARIRQAPVKTATSIISIGSDSE